MPLKPYSSEYPTLTPYVASFSTLVGSNTSYSQPYYSICCCPVVLSSTLGCFLICMSWAVLTWKLEGNSQQISGSFPLHNSHFSMHLLLLLCPTNFSHLGHPKFKTLSHQLRESTRHYVDSPSLHCSLKFIEAVRWYNPMAQLVCFTSFKNHCPVLPLFNFW